ncbi:uncharacterized protein LOC144579052 [Callithrix jacchus]
MLKLPGGKAGNAESPADLQVPPARSRPSPRPPPPPGSAFHARRDAPPESPLANPASPAVACSAPSFRARECLPRSARLTPLGELGLRACRGGAKRATEPGGGVGGSGAGGVGPEHRAFCNLGPWVKCSATLASRIPAQSPVPPTCLGSPSGGSQELS